MLGCVPSLPIFLFSRVTKVLKQIRKLAHRQGPITGPSDLHNVVIDVAGNRFGPKSLWAVYSMHEFAGPSICADSLTKSRPHESGIVLSWLAVVGA
jgi:hypothetical protein